MNRILDSISSHDSNKSLQYCDIVVENMWKLVFYCSFLYCLMCEEHNVTITRVEDGDVITADNNVLKLDCSQIQGSKQYQQLSCKCEKNRSIFHQYPNQTYGCYQSQMICKGINLPFEWFVRIYFYTWVDFSILITVDNYVYLNRVALEALSVTSCSDLVQFCYLWFYSLFLKPP